MGLRDNGRKELEAAPLSMSFAVEGNREMGCSCGRKWGQEKVYSLDRRIKARGHANHRG